MKLTFRVLAILAVVLGAGVGLAFGIGYAAGSPRNVSTGMTAQQYAQLYGGAGGAGASTAGGGAAGARTIQGGAAGGIVSRNPAGKISAIDGSTITLDTPAGPRKISL